MKATRTVRLIAMAVGGLQLMSCAAPPAVNQPGMALDASSERQIAAARDYAAKLKGSSGHHHDKPSKVKGNPTLASRKLVWPAKTVEGEPFEPVIDSGDYLASDRSVMATSRKTKVKAFLLAAVAAARARKAKATPTPAPVLTPSTTPTTAPVLTPTTTPTTAPVLTPTTTPTTAPVLTPSPITSIDPPADTQVSVNGRILVICATGDEPALASIKQTLEYLGTPYTVWVASQKPGQLTNEALANGTNGLYQGVILTDNSLGFSQNGAWVSALSITEWATLAAYEAAFAVRQVSWYAYPSADLGFAATNTPIDTSATPLATTLTAQGRGVYSYLNSTADAPIRHAYTYKAKLDGTGSAVPLVTDADGNALAVIRTYPDGREVLAQTFDSSPYLMHAIAFSYGLVNWVTKGVFIGERKTYASAQVDDVFLDNDMFPVAGNTDPRLFPGEEGPLFRLNGEDVNAFERWQRGVQAKPVSADFKTDMAYNGLGTSNVFFSDPEKSVFLPDTQVPALLTHKSAFKWISHTYSHPYLDAISYNDCTSELISNNLVASSLALTGYTRANLVTPNVSGLNNPNAMKAMFDQGVRYVVSDTSIAGQDNPSPNAGILNPHQPGILMIPRRPTNLYYNVSNPTEWMAEYNTIYNTYWGRNLTYQEILDNQADLLLQYMLRGEADPWMFHQANMRAYDGTHSLLGDLLDRTFEKYARLVNFPILSPTMDDVGKVMANRMRLNTADVSAKIVPGVSITFTATADVTVPVTGLAAGGATFYGSTPIASIPLRAGQSITLPLPATTP